MKNKITILFFAAMTLTAFGQQNETVDLNWKIGENEKLKYITEMSSIDESSLEMNLGGFFGSASDSIKIDSKEFKDLFKKMKDVFKDQKYITTLTNKNNGVIDIVMTMNSDKSNNKKKVKGKRADFFRNALSQGVMLRGSVYETGEIHSFWVKSGQKNLIALLFELPSKPVKVGDKWALDVNLIGNDQNFDCKDSYKINEVTLDEIKKIDGETIAVLKYNIAEYVEGDFSSPLFFSKDDKQEEMTMKFTYQGIAEFSVERGRWINYDGIMSVEMKGMITSNNKTKYKLIEEK